jgi:hypothetical protein
MFQPDAQANEEGTDIVMTFTQHDDPRIVMTFTQHGHADTPTKWEDTALLSMNQQKITLTCYRIASSRRVWVM